MTPPRLKRFLGRGAAGAAPQAMDVDELQGLLLQIAFAIMIVFMMAYFLFRADTRKRQEEQVLETERQKLVIAAEAVEGEMRARYGLDVLEGRAAGIGAPAAQGRLVEGDALTSDPIAAAAFLKAARSGGADFAAPLELRRRWIGRVCEAAQLDQSSLSREGAEWLSVETDAAIARCEDGIRGAEYRAASELQGHWLAKPETISDPLVADILAKLDAAQGETRLLLVTELSAALRRLALSRLSEIAGAEMLR
jgi:hypothetical protein